MSADIARPDARPDTRPDARARTSGSTTNATSDVLADRLREVGFSERAVSLIVDQVRTLGYQGGQPTSAGGPAQGLAEAHAPAYDPRASIAARSAAMQSHRRKQEEADAAAAESERTATAPAAAEPAAPAVSDPDLPLAAAGLVGWLLVAIGSWAGLTCEPGLLGVGDVEIVGARCAGVAPGLLSFAGAVTALWLVAPAFWHPIARRFGVGRLASDQARRATTIWAGFAALMSLTLVLAS
ncbi:MAG: hypothetical protein KDE35_06235 [Geminicoccaceae bacterium]|nr:hypothetical protein [Geminicoccaceae bacterium]